MQGNDLRIRFKLVQVISPLLHHLAAFGQVGCAVVGAPIRVSNRMGELMFDKIGAKTEHFIKNGSRHSQEAVTAHFFLVYAHAPHSGKDRIVAHGSAISTRAGENEAPSASQG